MLAEFVDQLAHLIFYFNRFFDILMSWIRHLNIYKLHLNIRVLRIKVVTLNDIVLGQYYFRMSDYDIKNKDACDS